MKLSGDAAYTGDCRFRRGNDSLAMEGSSSFVGLADFGGGADSLTIGGSAVFSGTLAHSAGLAVTVNGGAFDVGGAATLSSPSGTHEGILAVPPNGGDRRPARTVTRHSTCSP